MGHYVLCYCSRHQGWWRVRRAEKKLETQWHAGGVRSCCWTSEQLNHLRRNIFYTEMLKNYHCAVFHNRVIPNGKYEASETIAIGYHTYDRSTLDRNL